MDAQHVILVEDDAIIAELLMFNLKGEGYLPQAFRDGASLFQVIDQLSDPALFILDLMLPGLDGYEICRRLRANARFELTPILMLTARGTESDKIKGLDIGADDYLTKPFSMRELLARVNAQTRRYRKIRQSGVLPSELTVNGPVASAINTGGKTAGIVHPGQINSENILLDDVRHRVFRDGREIEMTNREYELLKHLMTHPGVAFSRDELLDRVWGYEYGGETRTVDVHIRQLRRKLEKNDADPILIETVRGRGYRWTDLTHSQTE
ncbi:MAG TPA: DNA-binding response regulator [Clostridiales bacterium]|nr:DNA-binding response regulator [Clostridiales bacterium]